MYRTVLITGASRGIGRGLALWFARRGARVWAVARTEAALESLKREAPPGTIEACHLDVTNTAMTIERLRHIDDACGGLDLVIANAGQAELQSGPVPDWALVDQTIALNVAGASATLVGLADRMVARGRGHLVGLSSLAAYRGLPRSSAYSASKAFLSTFLEELRVNLRGTGVHVTTLEPGFVATEAQAKNPYPKPFMLDVDDAVDRMGKAITRRSRHCAFPLVVALAMRLSRLLPRFLWDRLASRFA